MRQAKTDRIVHLLIFRWWCFLFFGRAFAAEAEPSRLYGNASIRLEAIDDGRTRRRIDGDFFVKFPLVGGTAERRIVPGLVRRLDIEADAVSAALAAD